MEFEIHLYSQGILFHNPYITSIPILPFRFFRVSMSAIASMVGFPSAAFTKPLRRRAAVAMASPAAERTATTVGRGLYGVLGLSESASAGEIKAAYRSLAKRLHPDVAGDGNAGEFLEIQRAYATLSDSEKRQRYDRSIGRIRLGIQRDERFRTSRRWETDQCW